MLLWQHGLRHDEWPPPLRQGCFQEEAVVGVRFYTSFRGQLILRHECSFISRGAAGGSRVIQAFLSTVLVERGYGFIPARHLPRPQLHLTPHFLITSLSNWTIEAIVTYIGKR